MRYHSDTWITEENHDIYICLDGILVQTWPLCLLLIECSGMTQPTMIYSYKLRKSICSCKLLLLLAGRNFRMRRLLRVLLETLRSSLEISDSCAYSSQANHVVIIIFCLPPPTPE